MRSQLPWWVLPAIAAAMLVIFAGALVASVFFLQDQTLRTAMFTATVTLTTNAVGYYFGSSRGSEKKDDIIAASKPPPQP